MEAGLDSEKKLSQTSKVLKPLELELYRLAPTDAVLERRIVLIEGIVWAAVLPDAPVPALEPTVSWRKWAFELVHLTLHHAHRTAGETFQLLRRMAYWSSLSKDLDVCMSKCEACQRVRARPVQGPLRSITGQDSMRRTIPRSDVIIDVQGPYTRAEGVSSTASPTIAQH